MLTCNIQAASKFYLHAFWDNFFSEEELKKMEGYCDALEVRTSAVGAEGNIKEDIRRSKHCFVNITQDTAWMFEKLKTITSHMNSEFFRFDLVGFDHFQYTLYDEEGSKYSTHMDLIPNVEAPLIRKLSFSLLLSGPDQYEGGEFEIVIEDTPQKIETKRGRLIAFPSFVPHRVTPVTKGVRKSIVIWVLGPRFK